MSLIAGWLLWSDARAEDGGGPPAPQSLEQAVLDHVDASPIAEELDPGLAETITLEFLSSSDGPRDALTVAKDVEFAAVERMFTQAILPVPTSVPPAPPPPTGELLAVSDLQDVLALPVATVVDTVELAESVLPPKLQPDLEERTQAQDTRLLDREARQADREEVRAERGAGLLGPAEDLLGLFLPPTPQVVPRPLATAAALVVEAEHHPEVVQVGAPNAWRCSGTILSTRMVLTAAHCLPAAMIRVHDGGGEQTAAVVRSVPHPDGLDVALLFLDRDLVVRTPIWRLSGQDRPPTDLVQVVGFGRPEHGGAPSGEVKVLDVVSSGWGCSMAQAQHLGCRPGQEMSLSGFGRPDSCNGDSGGPVFEEVGSGWRLIAVTSRSVREAITPCGDGGIYTRVDAFSDWMLVELRRPPTTPTTNRSPRHVPSARRPGLRFWRGAAH